jgi:biopolymer transport protein TolR
MAFSSRARRKSSEDDELDITPMIDMTFLLLIFFMVTSTMESPEALAIPESKWGQGVEAKDAIFLTIDIIDDAPSVYLSEKIEGSPVSLAEVTAYVQSRISPTKNIVILKSDRDVPEGFVQDVARAVNEIDVDYELLFYTAVDYKK